MRKGSRHLSERQKKGDRREKTEQESKMRDLQKATHAASLPPSVSGAISQQ